MNSPKFRVGDKFEYEKGQTRHFYKDWETVVIAGEPYQRYEFINRAAVSYNYFYPVLVNGNRYEVIPEENLLFNFNWREVFVPGYFIYNGDSSIPPSAHWHEIDPNKATGCGYTRVNLTKEI